MNVTLFPVAAFLLLLSGIGAPAHTAAQGETSAAFMRVLFGKWDGVPTATRTTVLASPRMRRAQASDSRLTARSGSPFSDCWSELGLAQRVVAAPGAFEQKQYRTRFGFAEGAYLALGPPVFGLETGFDCPLS
ncbi:MAG: hypothetical protein ACRYFU_04150 [Janthinobacterium lividum]